MRALYPSEQNIHKALVSRLRVEHRAITGRGVFWCHIPNGENRSAKTGALLKALGVRAGVPDFLFIIEGEPKFLELKTEKGRLGVSQKSVLEEIAAAGGHVAVAYGLNSAIDALERWGVLGSLPINSNSSRSTLVSPSRPPCELSCEGGREGERAGNGLAHENKKAPTADTVRASNGG